MAYQTVQLLLNVNEDTKPNTVIDHAIEFARREAAHLSALIIAQIVDFPGHRPYGGEKRQSGHGYIASRNSAAN